MADESNSIELLNDLVARALKAGADAADLLISSQSHSRMHNALAKLKRSNVPKAATWVFAYFLVKNKLSRLRRILVKMHWLSWSNARSPWRKQCRMTRTAVLPTRNRY